MNIGFWFWVIYVVGLIFFGFGVYRDREYPTPTAIFWWVLIALLGIGTFGGPIK